MTTGRSGFQSRWRWLVVVGLGVVVLLVAELAGRSAVPRELLDPDQAWVERGDGILGLAPNLDGWMGLARFRTGPEGHRATDLPAPGPSDETVRFLLIGGEFLAGFGLTQDELVSARLQRSLQEEAGIEQAEVVVEVLRGSLMALRPRVLALIEKWAPDRLVLVVGPESADEDAALLELDSEWIAEPTLEPSLSALWFHWQRWRLAGAREEAEALAAERVSRDGFTYRPVDEVAEWVGSLKAPEGNREFLETRSAVLNMVLEGSRGIEERRRKKRLFDDALGVFDELLRTGTSMFVLELGPRMLVAEITRAAKQLRVPLGEGPPREFDSALRMDGSFVRDSAILHRAAADCILGGMFRRHLLPNIQELPPRVTDTMDQIDRFHGVVKAHELDLVATARHAVAERLSFDGEVLPVGALDGLDPEGRILDSVFEVVTLSTAGDRVTVELRGQTDVEAPASLEVEWLAGRSDIYPLTKLQEPPQRDHWVAQYSFDRPPAPEQLLDLRCRVPDSVVNRVWLQGVWWW